MFQFDVVSKSTKNRARRGVLKTPHGDIQTPAFVTVGTKATVKSLSPVDADLTRTQLIFGNTYHLVLSPGTDLIKKAGGIQALSGINKPFITDSGGFQVFSLAFQNRKNMYELNLSQDDDQSPPHPSLVKITDDGVKFKSHIDGTEFYFTPEFSIKAQADIGADFIVAFDECIYNGATKKYTEQATNRTHEWAIRSLNTFAKESSPKHQQMFGVIQGGLHEDLRLKSTEFIAAQNFFGIGLGGVSVGETNEELRTTVTWIMNTLHSDPRPRHLLGISTLDDVLYSVKHGVDTFDCVLPTRDARVGFLYVNRSIRKTLENYDRIKITQSAFKNDLSPIDKQCECYTCQHFSRAYLHHLFKQRELLGYRLATIHNLYFIEDFFKRIREAIEQDLL